MKLQISLAFDAGSDTEPLLESVPQSPAVFALHLEPGPVAKLQPYLSRTSALRRRLTRLLGEPRADSKRLSLREFTRRIEYQCVGSSFEGQWLLYHLSRFYYPRLYRQRLRLKVPPLLKLNFSNRFPRCYPTRRLANDGALYYGPFPSKVAAERFAAEFLDFFKIRRCVEDLNPDPSHPGCIYSQMRMCLAPCFAGCTDEEYQQELARVIEALDGEGEPLLRALKAARTQASEALDFEQAGRIHRKVEKAQEVFRQKSELVRNLQDLHAVIVLRGAEPKTVVFFRVCAGEIRGPATLSFDENVPSPVPLDEQLHTLLHSLADPPRRLDEPPPWEHLRLLTRWYYSSFREGELVMLNRHPDIPHARLIRLCRKMLAMAT